MMSFIFVATFIHLITTYTSNIAVVVNGLEIEEIVTPPDINLSQINTNKRNNVPSINLSQIKTNKRNNIRSMFISDPKSIEPKTSSSSSPPVSGGTMCDGYSGILMINSGDVWAASGTSFFLYPINQILYAERNNLLPWAHFTAQDSQIWDHDVHDSPPRDENGKRVSFVTQVGAWITEIWGEGDFFCFRKGVPYPGPPEIEGAELYPKRAVLETSGVWEHYFEPLSAFHPQSMTEGDRESCGVKPFLELTMGQLEQGIHVCAPWALRSWPYKNLPHGNRPHDGMYNWLGRMRKEGTRITSKYIHPKPWLVDEVDRVNPIDPNSPPCLAMHIRHTDKGGHRTKVSLEEFLPYAESFVNNGGESIYLATDQLQNVDRIRQEWPEEVSRRVRRQENAFLSDSDAAIFHMVDHHRANTEALIDIYAMARCGWIVHGFSAISEAAIYVGDLHRYSVNLEDEEQRDLDKFAERVRERMEGANVS